MDATTGYQAAADHYLESEVLTAPPEKLHLMLIQGAIRFIRQGQAQWQAQQPEAATESLIRAQEIVGEMLASLKPEQNQPLVSKVAAVYMFVFRSLVTAQLNRDEKALADALRVLQIEEETWQQVCRQLAAQRGTGSDDRLEVRHEEQPAPPQAELPSASPGPHAAQVPPPPLEQQSPGVEPPAEGFSLEA